MKVSREKGLRDTNCRAGVGFGICEGIGEYSRDADDAQRNNQKKIKKNAGRNKQKL